MATHASRHIILGNRFDLQYVGTGEGNQIFGHGLYLEQSPEVAEVYRRKGFPTHELISFEFVNSKGEVISPEDTDYLCDDLSYYNLMEDWKLTASLQEIKQVLLPVYEQAIKDEEDIIKQNGFTENDFEFQLGKANIKSFKDKIKLIKSISEIRDRQGKRGNVYTFSIPDDGELLDWDVPLVEQMNEKNGKTKQVRDAIYKAVEMISTRSAEVIADGFSEYLKSDKDIVTLQHLIEDLQKNYEEHNDDEKLEAIKKEFISKAEKLFDTKDNQVSNNLAYKLAYSVENSVVNKLNKDATGENLYSTLTGLFGGSLYGRDSSNKKAREKASMYLDSLGIPGHRYLDGLSRKSGEGTYNFVVWNDKYFEAVDITDDSDDDAKGYFAKTKAEQERNNSETYNQIVGIKGARELDKSENVTWRMDNLKIARAMKRKGLSAKDIWLATGWQRGTEGEWRMELPYGKLIDAKFQEFTKIAKGSRWDFFRNIFSETNNTNWTIKDIFDAPELYKAYPILQTVPIYIADSDLGNTVAYYIPTEIVFNPSNIFDDDIQEVLIHELQHVIQDIEGFVAGGEPAYYDEQISKHNKTINSLNKDIQYWGTKIGLDDFLSNKVGKWLRENSGMTVRELYERRDKEIKKFIAQADKNELNVKKYLEAAQALDEENENWEKKFSNIQKKHSKLTGRDIYDANSGEVEARNAARRSKMLEDKRKNTPLDETEDVPRSQQFVEKYNQRVCPKFCVIRKLKSCKY